MSGQGGGSAAGRSNFSFDRPKKGQAGKQAAASGASAKIGEGFAAVKQASIPPAPTLQQQPKKSGNAKKNKSLRKDRKAEKEARKQAEREQVEQAKVVSSRAAEAMATSKDDGPTRVTYIDYDKTADAFQRVKDWQETGKKRHD